ncbi:PRC-barrel domain-containing protein [Kitasatospora sp. NPDC002227]|uniref:PRC-barrel domain-containing protein n=1 Tax=Kitasatospora sp. NPDC002227 TaxID=3154773 RepID=UPI0033251705
MNGTGSGDFPIWDFRETAGHVTGSDLVGFHVEAVDGSIGKVDRLSDLVEDSYLVVDTGPWVFGRLVLLPAGTVLRVDQADRKVYVDRTKSEIKHAPPLVPDFHEQETAAANRDRYTAYYGPFYGNPVR